MSSTTGGTKCVSDLRCSVLHRGPAHMLIKLYWVCC
jgi:hypothetical protein